MGPGGTWVMDSSGCSLGSSDTALRLLMNRDILGTNSLYDESAAATQIKYLSTCLMQINN